MATKIYDFLSEKFAFIRRFRLNRLRNYGLKYINLLDTTMKLEGWKRQKRRQYWRDLVKYGRLS